MGASGETAAPRGGRLGSKNVPKMCLKCLQNALGTFWGHFGNIFLALQGPPGHFQDIFKTFSMATLKIYILTFWGHFEPIFQILSL